MEGYGLYVSTSANILIDSCEALRNGPEPQQFTDRMMGTGFDTFELRNSILTNNTARHNIGGGFLVEDGAHVRIENNTARNNLLDAQLR